MTEQQTGFDPIGPGTPAWELADEAIREAVNGRPNQHLIDEMVRQLIDHGCSVTEIREWEQNIAERVSNPDPDDLEVH